MTAPETSPSPDVPRAHRRPPHLGPLRLTPAVVLISIVLVGSLVFIGYVMVTVHDDQIPLLAGGFVALGAAWAAIAFGLLVGMWRAASVVRTRRAVILAFLGGFAALSAIGSFSIAALLTLVWNT